MKPLKIKIAIPIFDEDKSFRKKLWNTIQNIGNSEILDDLNLVFTDKLNSFASSKERFDSKLSSYWVVVGIILSFVSAVSVFLITEKIIQLNAATLMFVIGLILIFCAFVSIIFNSRFRSVFSDIQEMGYLELGQRKYDEYQKYKIFLLAYASAKNNYYLEWAKNKSKKVPFLLFTGFLILIVSAFGFITKCPDKQDSNLIALNKLVVLQNETVNSVKQIEKHLEWKHDDSPTMVH